MRNINTTKLRKWDYNTMRICIEGENETCIWLHRGIGNGVRVHRGDRLPTVVSTLTLVSGKRPVFLKTPMKICLEGHPLMVMTW